MNLVALKSSGDLATEILMSRTAFSGSFLIVEGEDDSRFFKGRVARGACEIVIAGGKPALEGSIARLDAQRFRGALGVCDDDCESLNGHQLASLNIVVTDAHDLDTWLIRSPALDRVLAEYGDPKAIEAFEQTNGSVRDNLVRLALPFGQLRWVSARDRIGINFKPLSPHQFVKSGLTFEPKDLLLQAAAQVSFRAEDLQARVDSLPTADPWLVCQGHDLLAILAIGLKGVLGSRNPKAEIIASTLRASLDTAHWQASQLVTDIRQWESNNSPYRVL